MSSELKIIWKRKINLDITYSCSLKCFNCSRLCNLPQTNIKPLTPEDAKLELKGKPRNSFLVFINIETGKVNVIYKLKDGKNYGLVEPEA